MEGLWVMKDVITVILHSRTFERCHFGHFLLSVILKLTFACIIPLYIIH